MTAQENLFWNIKSYEDLSNLELYEILKARNIVFICEQKIDYQDLDDFDQKAIHICLNDRITKNVIAYARILAPGIKYPEATVGRVLTITSHRGKAIGKELIKRCLEYIEKEFPEANIKISAQQYLEQFYKEFGFKTVGLSYMEEGILHIGMLKAFNKLGAL